MAASGESLKVFIGYDDRESVASEVAKYSIFKRTKSKVDVKFLNHMELREAGVFYRPWITAGATGQWMDLVDGKPFSTQFSHTRFLVPHLMGYKGWALFMDADMIFQSDIQKLFDLRDNRYAAMCVKHQHKPLSGTTKMDGREQLAYYRKNWSSFVLWNCGHPANAYVTTERVNSMKGNELHGFKWLADDLIGELPWGYNYISGVSPRVEPQVIHYTEGGPWFPNMPEVPYGERWLEEYEEWQQNSKYEFVTDVPASMEKSRAKKPLDEYKFAGGDNILEMAMLRGEDQE